MAEKRNTTFMLSDGMYNLIKKLVQVILPAFGALYFGLAGIWGLPYADKVTGTIVVLTTFLGVCLGISTAQYNASGKAFDGQMVVHTNQETGLPKVARLAFDGEAKDLEGKESITFKVSHETLPVVDTPPLP